MKDDNKTKGQLINELVKLRRRIAELEVAEAGLKQAQERIGHLNLVLRAIGSVNQLLSKERNRHKLVKGICDSLIENRGYYNAWIAILDESRDLITTAEAGLGKEFLPMRQRLKRGEFTHCAQRALARPEVVVTEDPFSVCEDCPLSKKYAGRGAMTIRLECEGEVYGLLSVSIPRDLLPDKDEQAIFKEVAGDIAFALHSLELKEGRKRTEEALRKSMHELGERGKELNCLYAISSLVEKRDISLEEILQGTVQLIPPAWQYPEITCARIMLEGQEFRTSNFDETIWKQASDIIVHGKPSGILEVCCLEKRPESNEGPFLKEEGSLINAIAERLGRIIERRQGEEALLESERRFRDLVENALIGIFIIQDGQIVYKNPEQERLSGPSLQPIELIDLENVHPDDVEKVTEFYQRITSGDARALDTDFRFYPPGKMHSRHDMKWVYCRASLIEYQRKEAMLVNMMDMTAAKELEHLVRIQDKMSSLGRVAAGIAHEIRNPLSGINIYLNTLEKICDRGEGLEKVKEILGRLQSASSKIESVIRRVMDFSKPSEPKFVLTDINQPIEEAINLSSVTLRKSGTKVEKALTKNLPPCRIDQHLIEEVILNLITNAAEAMKGMDGDKKIEIASFVEGNHILVSVSDSGPGVPADLGSQIFDPFYTTKSGSTGIGLSLSNRIVKDHGGSLRLFTSKWGGAEFMIEIPVEKATDQE